MKQLQIVIEVCIIHYHLSHFLSVCSQTFNKCYILVDNMQDKNKDRIASWSFVQSHICRTHNWTMVSLHSELEQNFVGYMLLHRLNHTNNAYTYIGKDFKWLLKFFKPLSDQTFC